MSKAPMLVDFARGPGVSRGLRVAREYRVAAGLLSLMLFVHGASARYNVREEIPEASRSHLITAPLQRLVDRCAAAGGGVIYFPAGDYLTGSLELRDNIWLELGPGATLYGSTNMADYTRPGLIYAKGARAFGITGPGTINGNGEAFWKNKPEPLVRPDRLIQFEDCRDIRLNGLKLLNSPNWNCELLRCRFVWVDGVTIISPLKAPNTDGIDPTSSSDVFISNCYIETGDDAICPKSVGNIPTQNIVVQNCVLISDDTAIKLGTRSEAPIRNLLFNNIVIRNTQYGVGFYAKDGGVFENVRFSNVSIQTVTEEDAKPDRPSGSYAIFLDIERRKPDGPVSGIRDIHFNDIAIESVDARCLFLGMPEQPIEGLHLRNVNYTQLRHRTFDGSKKPRGVKSLKQRAPNDYSHIPANFGFAHVRGLDIDGLTIRDRDTSGLHERHMIWGYDVRGARIDGLVTRCEVPNATRAQLHFKDSTELEVVNCSPQATVAAFLCLEGKATDSVCLQGNNLRHFKTPIQRDATVRAGAVELFNPLPADSLPMK